MSQNYEIEKIDVAQVPTIIQEQLEGLQKLKDNVAIATERAQKAQQSAKTAKNKSAGLFQKKEAIESLQSATVDLADAQISSTEAQQVSFEYQQRLSEITKFLFGMG